MTTTAAGPQRCHSGITGLDHIPGFPRPGTDKTTPRLTFLFEGSARGTLQNVLAGVPAFGGSRNGMQESADAAGQA